MQASKTSDSSTSVSSASVGSTPISSWSLQPTRAAVWTVAAYAAVFGPMQALADAPGTVISTSVGTSVIQSGTHTQVNSIDAVGRVDWSNMDVANHQTMNFNGGAATQYIHNKVYSTDPTLINGAITSNVGIIIENHAGITVGPDGSIFSPTATLAGASQVSVFDSGSMRFEGVTGDVTNYGTISAGEVNLVGAKVANHGRIIAPEGAISMVAGSKVVLMKQFGQISVRVEQSELPGEDSSHAVENTGTISATGGRLTLSSGDMYSLAIKNSGSIKAKDVEIAGGESGRVDLGGSVDVSNDAGVGGSVTVTGDKIAVTGDIDASGSTGGGNVRIGGDLQGGGDLQTASFTYVSGDAVIDASAAEGDGGTVIVWSDQKTTYQGHIDASADGASGDGGFIEVSGKDHLAYRGTVDIAAANGEGGSLLLDPSDLTVQDAAGTIDGAGDPFTATADGSTVSDDAIEAVLNGGGSVTLTTTNGGGSEVGNVVVNADADINKTAGADATLTINASGGITLNGDVTSTAGTLGLRLLGDDPVQAGEASNVANDGDITIASNISLNGGLLDVDGESFTQTGGTITATGGIDINTVGNISLSGDVDGGSAVDFQDAVLLTSGGTQTITGSDVTFASTLGGGASTLNITGNLDLDGAATGLTALDVSGTSNLGADVTTTTTQNYQGAVTLSGGNRTLTASEVNFESTLAGGTNDLTVTGNLDLDGAATGVGALDVTGTSNLGADVTTTTTQNYQGAVTLSGGNRTLTASEVNFESMVAGGGNNLTVTGNLDLDASAANLGALDVTGTSNLGANVSTAGLQNYQGAVTLSGGNRTLTTGSVNFESTLAGGTNDLTVVGNFDLDGAATGLGALDVSGASNLGGDVTTTTTQNYQGAVTLSGGNRTLTASEVNFESTFVGSTNDLTVTGNLDLDGAATGVGALDVTGTSNLGANVTSTGLQNYQGAVTLSGGNRTLTASEVNFESTLAGGGNTLAVTGNFDLDDAATALAGLTVSGTSSIGADITSTGEIDLAGAATLTANTTLTGVDGVDADGYGVDLNAVTMGGFNLTIAGGGLLEGAVDGAGALQADTASISAAIGGATPLTSVNITGASTIGANVSTTGTQTYTGASTLGADVTLTGTTVAFGNTVEGTAAGTESLAITGNATFANTVGASTALEALSVSGTSTIDNNITATGGEVDLDGVVTLGGNVTLTGADGVDADSGGVELNVVDLNNFNLTIAGGGLLEGAVDGTGNLVADSATITAAIGGGTALTSVDINGTSSIGANVTTTAAQMYDGASTLTADVTLVGTAVSFGSTVDGTVAGNQSLTVTGNATFGGTVGVVNALEALSVSGTTGVNGNITTSNAGGTGNQDYTGLVTLNGDTTFTGNQLTFTAGANAAAAQNFAAVGDVILGGNITTNGNINITDAELVITADTELNGTNVITSGGITDGAGSFTLTLDGSTSVNVQGAVTTQNLTLDASTSGVTVDSINIAGNLVTVGTALTADTGAIAVGGTATVGGDVTSTTAGEIDIAGGTTLTANATLTGIDSDADTYGVDLNAVTMGGNTLTIAGGGLLEGAVDGAGALVADTASIGAAIGGVTPLTTVNITGASSIGANVTTTSTQNYGGAATLAGGNRTLAATEVTFGSTLAGGGNTLAITGNLDLDGTATALAGLTVSGTSSIGADITSTGEIDLAGAATLTANTTLTGADGVDADGYGVDLNAVTMGGFNLTIAGGGLLEGAVDGAGALVADTASIAAAIGGVTPLTSVQVNGITAVGADVSTSNNQNYVGAVTLSVDSNFTSTTGVVNFQSTVDGTVAGTESLTVTGNAEFDGAVGGGTLLEFVNVTGTSDIGANISTTNAGAGSGDQTYTGAVTLTADTNLTSTGGLVTFSSTVDGSGAGTESLTVTGNADIDGAIGGATALEFVNITGTTDLGANITTTNGGAGTGNQTYGGAVTLTADSNLISTGGLVTFSSTVDGTGAGTESMTVTGNADIDGTVGGGTALEFLTVTGTTDLGANVTTTNAGAGTGDQTYTGAVTLNVSSNLTSTGGEVNFQSTVDATGAGDETLTVTGNADFDGVVGGGTGLGELTVTGDATIADNITTEDTGTGNGNQTYGGATAPADGVTLTATNGTVLFDGLVSPNGTGVVGTLNVAGNLTFGATGSLHVDLAGNTTPGTDFDTVNLTVGDLTINAGATLTGDILAGAVFSVGDQFGDAVAGEHVISNAAGNAITGTFNSGADPIAIDGQPFTPTYDFDTEDFIITRTQATWTWDGGGVDSNFSTFGNWFLDANSDGVFNGSDQNDVGRPGDGDEIKFAGAVDLTPVNDLSGADSGVAGDLIVDNIEFVAGASSFEITGNNIGLGFNTTTLGLAASADLDTTDDGVTNSSANAQTLSNAGAASFGATLLDEVDLDAAAGALVFNNTFAGNFDVAIDGAVGAAVSFTRAFGNNVSRIGDGTGAAITINNTGQTQFDANVSAASGINAVDAAGAVVINGGTIDISVGNTATTFSNDGGVTLTTATINSEGNVTFGDEATDTLAVTGLVSTVDTSGATAPAGVITLNGDTTIGNGSTLSLNSDDVNTVISATAEVDGAGAAGDGTLQITTGAGGTAVLLGNIGANTQINSFASLGANGATQLTSNISTTGNMQFQNLTTVMDASPVTLTSTGGAIQFNNQVTAETQGIQGLTINAAAGGVTFDELVGNINPLAFLDVTGNTTLNVNADRIVVDTNESGNDAASGDGINLNGTLTTNGPVLMSSQDDDIQITGNVTIGGDLLLETTTSGNIELDGTVNANVADTHDLIFDAAAGVGTITAAGDIGNTGRLANLAVNNGAGGNFNGNVSLSGEIDLNTTDNDTDYTNGAANVVVNGTLTGTYAFGDAGTVTAGSLDTAAQNYGISFLGATTTFATTGDTEIDNTGLVILGNDAATDPLNNVTPVFGDIITVGGQLTINPGAGGLQTSGTIRAGSAGFGFIVSRPTTLNGDTYFDATNNNASSTSILFASPITGVGGQNLLFNSGNIGTIAVNADITNFGVMTVVDSGGATFNGVVNGTTVSLLDTTDGNNIDFQGNVTATNFTTAAEPYNIIFSEDVTITNAVDLTNTGTLTLGVGADGDILTFLGGLTATSQGFATLATNEITINGEVRSDGTAIVLGDDGDDTTPLPTDTTIALAGNSVIDTTNNGNVAAGGNLTLDGIVTGAANDLELDTGTTGDILANQAITGIGTLTITNSGGAIFNGAVDGATIALTDTTDGDAIDFVGDVTATTGMTTGTGAFNIIFREDATIAGATTLQNTGIVQFGDTTVGTTTPDVLEFTGGLTATSQGDATNFDAEIVISGTLETNGAAILLGDDGDNGADDATDSNITLLSDSIIDTTNGGATATGGDITLGSNVTAGLGAPLNNDLTLNAGTTGNIQIDQSVTNFDVFTLTNANTIDVATTGDATVANLLTGDTLRLIDAQGAVMIGDDPTTDQVTLTDGSLIIEDHQAGVTINATVNTGANGEVLLNGGADGQTVAFEGDLTTDVFNTLSTGDNGYIIAIRGGTTTITTDLDGDEVNFLNTGTTAGGATQNGTVNLILGDGGDNITFTEGFVNLANRTELNGNVAAFNNNVAVAARDNDIHVFDIILTGNSSIDSNTDSAGDLPATVNSTTGAVRIDGATNGGFDLVITTNFGNALLNGNFGDTTPLQSLTVTTAINNDGTDSIGGERFGQIILSSVDQTIETAGGNVKLGGDFEIEPIFNLSGSDLPVSSIQKYDGSLTITSGSAAANAIEFGTRTGIAVADDDGSDDGVLTLNAVGGGVEIGDIVVDGQLNVNALTAQIEISRTQDGIVGEDSGALTDISALSTTPGSGFSITNAGGITLVNLDQLRVDAKNPDLLDDQFRFTFGNTGSELDFGLQANRFADPAANYVVNQFEPAGIETVQTGFTDAINAGPPAQPLIAPVTTIEGGIAAINNQNVAPTIASVLPRQEALDDVLVSTGVDATTQELLSNLALSIRPMVQSELIRQLNGMLLDDAPGGTESLGAALSGTPQLVSSEGRIAREYALDVSNALIEAFYTQEFNAETNETTLISRFDDVRAELTDSVNAYFDQFPDELTAQQYADFVTSDPSQENALIEMRLIKTVFRELELLGLPVRQTNQAKQALLDRVQPDVSLSVEEYDAFAEAIDLVTPEPTFSEPEVAEVEEAEAAVEDAAGEMDETVAEVQETTAEVETEAQADADTDVIEAELDEAEAQVEEASSEAEAAVEEAEAEVEAQVEAAEPEVVAPAVTEPVVTPAEPANDGGPDVIEIPVP